MIDTRDLLADVLGDRDRLVGRAVPADPGDRRRSRRRAACAAWIGAHGPVTALASRLQQRRRCSVSAILCSMVRSTVTTHDVRLATSGRPMSSTIRPAGRLHDQLADRLLRGLGLVGLAAEDLQVPQPCEQRHEQRRAPAPGRRPAAAGPWWRSDGAEPGPPVRRAVRAASVGRACGISTRPAVRLQPPEQPHQQRQHERGEQHVVDDRDRDHAQRLADRDRRVVQQHAAQGEDRGADERAGGDRDQRRRSRSVPASWRTRPAR